MLLLQAAVPVMAPATENGDDDAGATADAGTSYVQRPTSACNASRWSFERYGPLLPSLHFKWDYFLEIVTLAADSGTLMRPTLVSAIPT